MREIPEATPAAEGDCPGAVTAALWVGWSYQILVMAILVLFHLPQQQAYIDSLANKPNQQWTQQDINMFLHPTASMIGASSPFLVMFLLSAWLLHKTGQGRVWARNVLIGLFAFRVMVGLAVNLNAFSLLDVIAQVAVIVLLLMPTSRAWFSAKNVATSGGAEDGYRVGI